MERQQLRNKSAAKLPCAGTRISSLPRMIPSRKIGVAQSARLPVVEMPMPTPVLRRLAVIVCALAWGLAETTALGIARRRIGRSR